MSIHIEDETNFDWPFSVQETADTVLAAVLDRLECPYEAEADLLLTTDEEIRDINQRTRGIDDATDVLSFPTAEYAAPADFDGLEEQEEVFDPDSGVYFMGDIVISADHAKAQAEAYGHSLKREVAFLITHSLLHLTGFDHMEEEMRLQMEQLQDEILDGIGITRT